MELKVSVSIVTHKTPVDELNNALSSLRRENVGRIFIIDNSPDDSLKEFCRGKDLIYTHVDNRGFGAGHNIAIRRAIAEGFKYHLVLNADVRWNSDVIRILTEIMDSDSEIGLVSPRVVYPDGTLQYSCRLLPTPIDLVCKRFLPEKVSENRMKRYLLKEADHKKSFFPSYMTGCFLLFRIEALEDIGLFDERFFMYPEDIDITRRIHSKWKTRFSPEAEIIHDHKAASRRNLKMMRIHISNMIKYFNKWGWIFDKERRDANRLLLSTMPRVKGKREIGRG